GEGDVLRDDDDVLDARVDGLQHGVLGELRGHVDDAGVGAGLLHGVEAAVEHGQAVDLLARLARRHAAHDLRAEVQHLLGVERALVARDALDDDLGAPADGKALGLLHLHGGRHLSDPRAWRTSWPSSRPSCPSSRAPSWRPSSPSGARRAWPSWRGPSSRPSPSWPSSSWGRPSWRPWWRRGRRPRAPWSPPSAPPRARPPPSSRRRRGPPARRPRRPSSSRRWRPRRPS